MQDVKKIIIAIGGGGFTHEPKNPFLDLYVLSQSPLDNPKIAFLPTANPNPEKYTQDFYHAFSRYSCQPSHLNLFGPHTSDLEDYLLSQDIIYVGGGNTKSMLAVWREWGLDTILRKAWNKGVVLAGVSAGAMCWFEEGITASIPGCMTSIKGLGLLVGSCCPHYDANFARQNAIHERVKSGKIERGYLIDDFAAIHFEEVSIKHAVSSIPDRNVSILKNHETTALNVHCLSKKTSLDINFYNHFQPL